MILLWAMRRAAMVVAVLLYAGDADLGAQQQPASSDVKQTLPRPAGLSSLHNVFQVSPRLWSGSSPETEAHFAALAKQGIRTIVSVDGAAPNSDLASKHGLRYVHLPIGYDGIAASRGSELARAARDLPGPIYVHCHHGKHRGPAAAALICTALDGWSREAAQEWMRAAGTSPEYRGLFETIAAGALPSAAEIDAVPLDFPARAATPPLVDTMVRIDELWSELRTLLKDAASGSNVQRNQRAAELALLLAEQFRELEREENITDDPDTFARHAREGRAAADALLNTVKTGRTASAAVQQVETNCQNCHRALRD